MEVVQLPPDSESEDEDDQEGEEGEERAIDDFLKDYPDDTEVSSQFFSHSIQYSVSTKEKQK